MKLKLLSIFAILFIIIGLQSFSRDLKVSQKDSVILFREYKYFVFYTRDSIMRELLSNHIEDFQLINYETNMDKINWEVPIRLSDEIICDILTPGGEYKEEFLFNFENNKLIIETSKLLKNKINIYPKNFTIDFSETENKLSVDENWLKKCDELNIYPFLNSDQINLYYLWKKQFPIKKVKKLLKNKIIPKNAIFIYDSTSDRCNKK